jgi:RNA polymerase sigma factor (sigma-70 family)
MASDPDGELLERARQGDAEAFEQLLSPHLPMLLAYSRAICGDYHAAQDVVQETALVAYRNLDHLFPEVDFAVWLRAIARRQALAARRALNRVGLIGPVGESLLEQAYLEPTPAFEGERAEALRHCLAELSGRMSEVVRAHYFQGSPLAQVARVMDTTLAAVKQLLYRARLWLLACVNRRLKLENPG